MFRLFLLNLFFSFIFLVLILSICFLSFLHFAYCDFYLLIFFLKKILPCSFPHLNGIFCPFIITLLHFYLYRPPSPTSIQLPHFSCFFFFSPTSFILIPLFCCLSNFFRALDEVVYLFFLFS